jgi:hypothetical protein
MSIRHCLAGLLAIAAVPVAALAEEGITILNQYCYQCHSNGQSEGELALDQLVANPNPSSAAWLKVWKMVRNGFMPPADADGLPESASTTLTHWIERERLGVDPKRPDPGRVTLRRLNRMEYEYTITDLFQTEIFAEGEFSSDVSGTNKSRLHEMLPPDDTAFGFDNIGDFQSLSPALLEKYLGLAEWIVERVIALDGPQTPRRLLEGLEVKPIKNETLVGHSLEFQIERPGTYRVELRFSVGGFQEYRGAYDLAASIDDAPLLRGEFEFGGQKLHQLSGEMELREGTRRLSITTFATKPDVKGKYQPFELRPKIILVGPLGNEFKEYPATHRRIMAMGGPNDSEISTSTKRERILRELANRAFRRPANEVGLQRLVRLAELSPQFERGIADAMVAILVSPEFLYRAELQPTPDDRHAVHPIDEHALASRLSYFLWLSIPDDELRRLADNGELRENLSHQLQRMLADEKSARFFEDFPGQWLRTRNVLMTPTARTEEFVNRFRASMKRETEMLFEHLARNDVDLLELVTADYSFLDRDLAEFYKVPFEGNRMQKTRFAPESGRGGLLGQATFLFSTSNPGRTSPVKRGLYVLENLLAIEPPPPPPSIPSLDAAKVDGETPKSIRAQLVAHRKDPSCAACHAHFDPIGLVFENFDPIGRWRDNEEGEPIEIHERTATGQTLTGVADLKATFVKQRTQFYRCVTEKLLTYALGRGLEPTDSPMIEQTVAQLAEQGGRFSVLLEAIVESRQFQMRRGDAGEMKLAPRVAIPQPPPPDQRDGKKFRKLIHPNEPPKKPRSPP